MQKLTSYSKLWPDIIRYSYVWQVMSSFDHLWPSRTILGPVNKLLTEKVWNFKISRECHINQLCRSCIIWYNSDKGRMISGKWQVERDMLRVTSWKSQIKSDRSTVTSKVWQVRMIDQKLHVKNDKSGEQVKRDNSSITS